MHGDRELQSFLEHLNGQCAESQFTMEETKGSIPFLNIHVKKDGSKLTTSENRKPTHTDPYLHYSSHHHPKVKSGITQTNRFANGDPAWQMKECMPKRFSWQMGTQSKQLRRSGGGDEMDAVVPNQGSECFCNTSGELVRRSVEHASHWVYRRSPLPEIPSVNPSQK